MTGYTKKERILYALQGGEVLTSASALTRFHTIDLRKRVSELRSEGYPILDKIVRSVNGEHYKEYFMEVL